MTNNWRMEEVDYKGIKDLLSLQNKTMDKMINTINALIKRIEVLEFHNEIESLDDN